jgi:hypothetical protein
MKSIAGLDQGQEPGRAELVNYNNKSPPIACWPDCREGISSNRTFVDATEFSR